jgi:hypothetical protein
MTFVKGKGSYMPFRPGGLDAPDAVPKQEEDLAIPSNGMPERDMNVTTDDRDRTKWSKFVPGLQRGIDLPSRPPSTSQIYGIDSADKLLLGILGDSRSHTQAARQSSKSKSQPIMAQRAVELTTLSTPVSLAR